MSSTSKSESISVWTAPHQNLEARYGLPADPNVVLVKQNKTESVVFVQNDTVLFLILTILLILYCISVRPLSPSSKLYDLHSLVLCLSRPLNGSSVEAGMSHSRTTMYTFKAQ